MTRTYTIAHLGCANCAAKMERRMQALPQVESAVLTFATGRLTITAADPDRLLPQLQQIVSDIEADAKIVTDIQGHHHHENCDCGHGHHHHENCDCGHGHHHHDHAGEKSELPLLLTGAGLFALGLVLLLLSFGIQLITRYYLSLTASKRGEKH